MQLPKIVELLWLTINKWIVLIDNLGIHLEAILNILTKWAPTLIDIIFKDIDWDTAALNLSGWNSFCLVTYIIEKIAWFWVLYTFDAGQIAVFSSLDWSDLHNEEYPMGHCSKSIWSDIYHFCFLFAHNTYFFQHWMIKFLLFRTSKF